MITVLAIGDLVGKPARKALTHLLPLAKAEFSPDLILANGENAAGGFGLTRKVFDQLTLELGIDVITMGNHWHDKKEIHDFCNEASNLVLPANMSNVNDASRGLRLIETRSGHKVAVANVIGKAFMHPENSCPFKMLDRIWDQVPERIKLRIVDFHGEASSEKQGIGHYMTGRASLVYGTHVHVPTADERILAGHTGFVTDLGMTGAYDSIIGMKKEGALRRLITGEKRKMEPAVDDLWMCFIVAECDPQTGRCTSIKRFRWEVNQFS